MDESKKLGDYVIFIGNFLGAAKEIIFVISLLIGQVVAINYEPLFNKVKYTISNTIGQPWAIILFIVLETTLLVILFRYLYEHILLKLNPNVYNIYIYTTMHKKFMLKISLKMFLKKEKIILRNSRTKYLYKDENNNLFRLHVNTKLTPEKFIPAIKRGFIKFNELRITNNKIQEFVACQKDRDINNIFFEELPINKTISDLVDIDEEFLKKVITHLCGNGKKTNTLDKENFIFLWNGRRLEIPFKAKEEQLHQCSQRLHLLIPNYLDSALCVFSPKDEKNIIGLIENNYSNTGDLEKEIETIYEKLIQEMVKKGIVKKFDEGKKICRISLFYRHYLFDKICGKPLVPYFSYRANPLQRFHYWYTEDLAEERTLYPEGILIGKCYSEEENEICVFVLPKNALDADEHKYAEAWLPCHPYKGEDGGRILDAVRRHHTRSQVHVGIRISKGKKFSRDEKHFILCFDIQELPEEKQVKQGEESEQQWQKRMQSEIKKIVEENYANGILIKTRLDGFCHLLYCDSIKQKN